MNRFTTSLIWPAALVILWANATRAEPVVPLPSVPYLAEGDGWAIALGAAVEYETEYDGADDYELEFDPAVAAQWRRGRDTFFFEGPELGWRRLQTPRFMFQTGLRFEGGRDEDDNDRLEGLGDTDDELMGMGEVRWGFTPTWKNWMAARAMAGDSDIGAIGILAAGHRFGNGRQGEGIEVFAFTTFATSDFINRDFGVTQEQSVSSGLPAEDLDGGYRSAGITALGRWNIGRRWQLSAEAGYEYYSSDIQDSPIAQASYETEVGLGVVYRFGSGVKKSAASSALAGFRGLGNHAHLR